MSHVSQTTLPLPADLAAAPDPTTASATSNQIPLSVLEQIANAHAQVVWGSPVAPGVPLPVLDPMGAPAGYAFPFLIGASLFPALEELEVAAQHERFGMIYVSSDPTQLPIQRVMNVLHPFYYRGAAALTLAGEQLGATAEEVPVLRGLVLLGPLEEYYAFGLNRPAPAFGTAVSSGAHDLANETSLIHVNTLAPTTLAALDDARPHVSAAKPAPIAAPAAAWGAAFTPAASPPTLIPAWESIPVIDWTYWCVPTAFAMLLGFYDHHADGHQIMGYGRLIDYWLEQFEPNSVPPGIHNIPNLLNKIIDPVTRNWNKVSLETLTGYKFDKHEIRMGAENDWNWKELTAEIDAGRPVLWGVPEHSMPAFGYRVCGGQRFVIVYTTWGATREQQMEEWSYTKSVGMSSFRLSGGDKGQDLALLDLRGGQTVYANAPMGIKFCVWGDVIKKVQFAYSENAGADWRVVATDVPVHSGNNTFAFVPPRRTRQARIAVRGYSERGALVAADGSLQSFVVAPIARGEWGKWEDFGRPQTASVAVMATIPSVIAGSDFFVVTTEGKLYYRFLRGNVETSHDSLWSSWIYFGPIEPDGEPFMPLLAVRQECRDISPIRWQQVFCLSRDGTLWMRRQISPNGDFDGWWIVGNGVPGRATLKLLADITQDDCYRLYALGSDGSLWHRQQGAGSYSAEPWQCFDAPMEQIVRDFAVGYDNGDMLVALTETPSGQCNVWLRTGRHVRGEPGSWTAWTQIGSLESNGDGQTAPSLTVMRSDEADGQRVVHIVAGVDRCIVHFWRTAKPGGELPGTWRQETLPQPAWSTRTPQRLTAGWSGSQLDVYGIMPEVEGSVAVHCVKDELAGDWGPWGLVGEGGAPGMKQIVIPAENLYGGSNGLLTEVAGLQTRDGSILTAPLYALASDSGKASQE